MDTFGNGHTEPFLPPHGTLNINQNKKYQFVESNIEPEDDDDAEDNNHVSRLSRLVYSQSIISDCSK